MSEEQKYHKCSQEEGFCPTLQERVQPAGSNCKGFITMTALRTDVFEVVLLGVMYKKDAKDNGLMLNVCPWCQERIDWFREDEK